MNREAERRPGAAPGLPTPAEVERVGNLLVSKMLAVHGQGGLLGINRESVLLLYALARFTHCQAYAGDNADFTDRHIASFLLGEPPPGNLPCLAMGGIAGAFRLLTGHYARAGSEYPAFRELAAKTLEGAAENGGFPVSAGPAGPAARAETMLEAGPFLAMASPVLSDGSFREAALCCCRAGAAILRDPETGLYRHARGWHEKGRLTPGNFLRAGGWAAAGLSETARHLPPDDPDREELVTCLASLLEALLPYQEPGGLWRMLVDEPASPVESSGSALVAFALSSALAVGRLPGKHLPAAALAWRGLVGCLGEKGPHNLERVCPDTGPQADLDGYRRLPLEVNGVHGFGSFLLACCGYFELARAAAWRERPEPVRGFTAPSDDRVREAFSLVHSQCEAAYNGDGSWGRGTMDFPDDWMAQLNSESRSAHPLARTSGYCVMGYLGAAAGGEDPGGLYRRRALEGLDWLLRIQEPDGSFRLHTRKEGGQAGHNGCLFGSGVAGGALLAGYESFGDKKYLEASGKLAEWEKAWPVVANVNFNSFAAWHLAAHYRLSGDRTALEAAVHRTRCRPLACQQASGGWKGHNSWSWYHSFLLRAYSALLESLPAGHPARWEIQPAALAAVDYLARLQNDDGSLRPNPSTERHARAEYAAAALCLAVRATGDGTARAVLEGVVGHLVATGREAGASYNDERRIAFKSRALGPALYALGSWLALSAAESEK